MAKEDILNKFEKENKNMDEGQLYQERRGDEASLLVFMLLVAVTMIFNRDVKVFALTVGSFLLSIGCGNLFKRRYSKSKKLLIAGILESLFGLLLYITFVFLTMGWI